MYCPQCGRQMPDDANNCPNCGRDFRQEAQESTEPPRPGRSEIAKAYGTIPNHLALSIIAIFLCLPFGIAGLIQSLKVDQFIRSGDFEAAKMFSEKAKTYGMIGVIVGGVLIVLSVILSVVFGFWVFSWMGRYRY
ncbi:MAG: CD225/dispanin family protein [Christensenellales bacterium]|jgi:RNA polymerase subunit RPABC4/transcription elongation factor Spt4